MQRGSGSFGFGQIQQSVAGITIRKFVIWQRAEAKHSQSQNRIIPHGRSWKYLSINKNEGEGIMTRKQLIEAIVRTYDEKMKREYGAWLKSQNKATLEQIYTARMEVKGESTTIAISK